MSIRDAIQAADDIQSEIVTVPEWGVEVQVRGLSVARYTHVQKAAKNAQGDLDLEKFSAALLVSALFDPANGEPVFTDNDAQMIASKSMQVVDRLVAVVNRLSGNGDDGDREKGVQQAGKD